MTTKSLREQVAEKMGWEWDRPEPDRRYGSYCWMFKGKEMTMRVLSSNPHCALLPAWDYSWEECACYVIPWMRERGVAWSKHDSFGMDGQKEWFVIRLSHSCNPIRTEIINDNLARAACEAMLKVEVEL